VKKRLRMYVIAIVAIVAVITAIGYFYTELSATVWHLRHGFHAEVGGIKVRIPLAYETDGSNGLASLLITRMSGNMWHGGGAISIDFHKQPSPEVVRLLESRGAMKKTKIGQQTASFAGRSGNCVESTPQTGNERLQRSMQSIDFREIRCWFGGDVEVTFRGTANLKNDFYSIIQSAALAQENAK
jgi:hypothetical protein